ncbi:hypothetical protein HDE_10471 [Halotydeus destructor]|nr:hypothetical protein HDE_10471 [Halotydeus destructor]
MISANNTQSTEPPMAADGQCLQPLPSLSIEQFLDLWHVGNNMDANLDTDDNTTAYHCCYFYDNNQCISGTSFYNPANSNPDYLDSICLPNQVRADCDLMEERQVEIKVNDLNCLSLFSVSFKRILNWIQSTALPNGFRLPIRQFKGNSN